jgi:hypothetical protein
MFPSMGYGFYKAIAWSEPDSFCAERRWHARQADDNVLLQVHHMGAKCIFFSSCLIAYREMLVVVWQASCFSVGSERKKHDPSYSGQTNSFQNMTVKFTVQHSHELLFQALKFHKDIFNTTEVTVHAIVKRHQIRSVTIMVEPHTVCEYS